MDRTALFRSQLHSSISCSIWFTVCITVCVCVFSVKSIDRLSLLKYWQWMAMTNFTDLQRQQKSKLSVPVKYFDSAHPQTHFLLALLHFQFISLILHSVSVHQTSRKIKISILFRVVRSSSFSSYFCSFILVNAFVCVCIYYSEKMAFVHFWDWLHCLNVIKNGFLALIIACVRIQ